MSKKNYLLQFMLDDELMDEILRRDIGSNFTVNCDNGDVAYKYGNLLKKSSSQIRDDGLLYLNEYLALDVHGKTRREKVIFKTADLEIIVPDYIVKKNGKILRIFPTSYFILEAFMRANYGVLLRDNLSRLLEARSGKIILDNTLNQHINRTKKALGTYKGKPYISTVYEIGYRWNFPIERIDVE